MIQSRISKPTGYAIVYTWDDGREEVRYRRPRADARLARELLTILRRARAGGYRSPYSLRPIDYVF